ncbi:MAG: hypothetical protein KDK99_02960 [Verrucomicrobiales bacterium]|nr:hypothetical protein [Verrucomicrobiales bacterium]
MGKVVVIGSLSYDCLAVVPEFPRPGQTVAVGEVEFRLGGTGGVQALAAAAQGAEVALIGCVGEDSAGDAYCAFLDRRGIDTAGVVTRAEAVTGTGLVVLRERDGVHATVAGACANARLDETEVRTEAVRLRIARSRVVLGQLGYVLAPLTAVLEQGRMMGSAACLNARPWADGFPWGGADLDFVIAGPDEARAMLGRSIYSLADADWVASALQERRVETLILQVEAAEAWVFSGNGGAQAMRAEVEAAPPVDTTGMEDAFAGAFAARWSEARDFTAAVKAALVAGQLCAAGRGGMESLPDRAAVDAVIGA